MPALDSLHLKGQLLQDMDSRFWRRYMDYFTDLETSEVSAGFTPGGDDSSDVKTPEQQAGQNQFAKKFRVENLSFTATTNESIGGGQDVDPGKNLTGEELTAQMRRCLMVGETFYISPTMHALVTAAAESLPAEEIVLAEDFPSLQGFLLIPGGIQMIDVRGKLCSTDAIMWDIYGGEVHLTYLVDKMNPVDANNTKLRRNAEISKSEDFNKMPRLTPWSFGGIVVNDTLPVYLALGGTIPPEFSDQIVITTDPITRKVTYKLPEGYDVPEDIAPSIQPDPTSRWLLACVKLMQQSIVSLTELQVPRADRRRMTRLNLSNRATVIELRHRKGEYDKETGREYSHRFLRRGHWRRQPYKDKPGGDWLYKTIFIHPTIVGDPDKPLILRDHVNALIR